MSIQHSEGRIQALVLLGAIGLSMTVPQEAKARIPYEVVASSRSTGVGPPSSPTTVVLRSAAEFEALWRSLGRRRGMPEVDFRRHSVIAYFLGGRPSGGYSIEVDNIAIQGGTMTVQLVEVTPGACCGSSLVATYPDIMIATIPWKREVEVRVRVEEKSCCP